jgi:hypothetical protein
LPGADLGPRKSYNFQNRQVFGQSVDFESKGEPWALYALEDGTTVKVKVVLLDVVRLEEYADSGEPIYQFSAQQIIAVQAPDELKKKAN